MKPRRWFRFTLRTFFVLVLVLSIPLGWLAMQLKWIRDRQDAREWIVENGAGGSFGYSPDESKFPSSLRVMGEKPCYFIPLSKQKLSKRDLEHIETIRSLFPEAEVNVF